MARLIFLTQEQFEAIRDIGAGLMEEVVLIAPCMAEKVRSHSVNFDYAASLYEIDATNWDLRAEVVNREEHNFMSFMDSEVRLDPDRHQREAADREAIRELVRRPSPVIDLDSIPESNLTWADVKELSKGVPLDQLLPGAD